MGEQKKKTEQERTDSPPGEPSGIEEKRYKDPVYRKSREYWKLYLEGKLTAGELEEYLAELIGEDRGEVERMVDFFDGRELGV